MVCCHLLKGSVGLTGDSRMQKGPESYSSSTHAEGVSGN